MCGKNRHITSVGIAAEKIQHCLIVSNTGAVHSQHIFGPSVREGQYTGCFMIYYCQAVSGDNKNERLTSDDDSDREPRKKGRPRAANEVKGFTNNELKRFLKSIRKFGRPLERLVLLLGFFASLF